MSDVGADPRACVMLALAEDLGSDPAEVARDVVRRLIAMLEKSRCVVLRVTHCSATAAVVVSRTAAGAISLSLAAGKSALVHTYRTPSYLRRGVRGAASAGGEGKEA